MSQARESGSHKRREKDRHRQPEHGGGGGRVIQDRPGKSSPSREDRSQISPANESRVWNGDDESDIEGDGREESGTRGRADEDDEK